MELEKIGLKELTRTECLEINGGNPLFIILGIIFVAGLIQGYLDARENAN